MACDGEAEEGGKARARLASWEGIYPTTLRDDSLRLDQKFSYVAQQGKVTERGDGGCLVRKLGCLLAGLEWGELLVGQVLSWEQGQMITKAL